MGTKRFIYLLLLAERDAGPTKAATNSNGGDKMNTAIQQDGRLHARQCKQKVKKRFRSTTVHFDRGSNIGAGPES